MLRFPEDISYGATGGPNFNTQVVTVASGAEKRTRLWETPIYEFECAHGLKTQNQLDELINFFYEVGGRAGTFRFKNWAEFILTQDISELTRPATDTLLVWKKYSTYRRRITKIVDGSFKLYADGVQVLTGFEVNIDTGTITLQFPASYPEGTVFTCECEFDFYVRFNTDSMPVSIDNYNVYSWNQIPLVEVRE